MPEIQFKGKEFVFNHHLSVPYRPLISHQDKSIGDGALNENLIVQGDNLHALKALSPLYAGQIDCVFIDPPYNTGTEGWCYNDNLNSPFIKDWLSSNPINKEDMLRHDKWLAMMYPRVKLIHELMADTGTIWITIDDNEMHRARLLLDEIFGEQNFIGCICWQKKYAPSNDTVDLSAMHDFILCYAKKREFNAQGKATAILSRNDRTDDQNKAYKNPDNDKRGEWKPGDYLCNKTAAQRPNLYYPIVHPKTGKEILPSKTAVWRYSKERHEKNVKENRVWWGAYGTNSVPAYKRFLSEVKGVVQGTWWPHTDSGHNDEAKKEIKEIFFDQDNPFDTPKPVRLIKKILELSTDENSIILDSFAGSGTTAQAVMELNEKDGGTRQFILVECEEYADKLTAERVRRVMTGYSFTGIQSEDLHNEKITFTSLKKANKILANIESIENLDGYRFDSIKKVIKDGVLSVWGEKEITEKVEGLGGSFTYCTLGDPIDLDKILTGESLPEFQAIGSWLFHTATGESMVPSAMNEDEYYLGESTAYHLWLIYKPDLDFLKSREAALTLSFAEKVATKKGKKHLIFAPAKYVPNKTLHPLGVEFAPLPFALYRVEK
ncbi:site-specific DNA-methyltransferase [Undibacterium sp.]|uniref:site-specific DNA-methyltransferase n=1 Tax=Undibacterium sp. TaxID=1914977 RepID=UPI0037525CB9